MAKVTRRGAWRFRSFRTFWGCLLGKKLGYRPALDGIRAVSIALVLVFHLGAPWLPGGYLGVSVFFTLSGFLITSLLLHERDASGRIDVRAFYVRRLRRLLPASLLCLAGIAVLAAAGTVVARADLRAGVLAAVFQVANWEHLLGHHSYADLFLAPSPIDHFWSLAIEEQFYWLWPLAIAGLTALAARRSRRFVPVVLCGAFVLTGAGALVTARTLGGDAAYFASWARFAEILAGAALASVLAIWTLPKRASLLGVPSLVAIVVLAVVTPAGRGWAYGGGLPLFALLSVALIAGTQSGPAARLLSREPLPWIGRISYGLYLFHWPVFTIASSASVIEKLTLTVALTVASYYLIERPIRTGRVLTAPMHYVRAAACAFVLVAASIAVLVPTVHVARASAAPVVLNSRLANSDAPSTSSSSSSTVPSTSSSAAPATATSSSAPASSAPASTRAVAAASPTTTAAPPRVPTVALFGDSIADWLLRDAAPTFSRTDVTVVDAAMEACDAMVNLPDALGRAGQVLRPPADCKEWPQSYPPVVENAAMPVDVAVLVLGNAPTLDHEIGGRVVGPCDDNSWYLADLEKRIGYLRQHVGSVVFVIPSWGGQKASFLAGDDHLARMACIRRDLTAFTARLGLPTVDLATVLCPAGPDGQCTDLRDRDGVHVDPDDAPKVLDWLLDNVLRIT